MPDRRRPYGGRLPWVGPTSLSAKLVWILSGIGMAGTIGIAAMLILVLTPGFRQLEEQSVARETERAAAVLEALSRAAEAKAREAGDRIARGTALPVRRLAQPGGAELLVLEDQADSAAPVAAALASVEPGSALGERGAGSFYVVRSGTLTLIGLARLPARPAALPRFVALGEAISVRQIGLRVGRPVRLVPATAPGRQIVRARGELDVRVPLPGWNGAPAAAIAFTVERDLWQLGGKLLMSATAGISALMLLLLILLRRIFNRLVLQRLHQLERHMHGIRDSGSMTELPDPVTHDEIGSLVASFNAMLSQLASLREQLEVQSFKLGSDESSDAVMHNVRNALSPISTILSKGLTHALPIDPATIDRALEEVGDAEVEPERRARLAAFLRAALAAERSARADRLGQLEMGREALQNVLEIIGSRPHKEQERAPLEPCDVTRLIARNGAIARYSRELSIATVFPSRTCMVRANRVILSQVIGNLFSNAAESIAASGTESGSIRVSIAERSGRIEVAILDNGEGFDPAEAPALFQRGFSTRKSRSGGLGLHWCANAMVAMGGSLRLHSDGRGRGARAVLTLQPAEEGTRSRVGA